MGRGDGKRASSKKDKREKLAGVQKKDGKKKAGKAKKERRPRTPSPESSGSSSSSADGQVFTAEQYAEVRAQGAAFGMQPVCVGLQCGSLFFPLADSPQ